MKKNKIKKFSTTQIILFILGLIIFIGSLIFSTEVLSPIDENNETLNIFYNLANETNNTLLKTIFKLIPDLIKGIDIIIIMMLLYLIISSILTKALNKNKKQITISIMIKNLLRYIFWIVIIILVLNQFGVDTATLITSAGVLTLVVGLGAQTLISDIISGISIVFDEQFEVGDVIDIDNFRGTVDQIGIRSTKIVGWDGHVKIINNSTINSLINESKHDTYASTTIDLDYNEDLNKVEKIIKDNLANLSTKVNNILKDVEYNGVSELKDSGVSLLFTVKCKTEFVKQVTRDLNKELKILFDENNITIPFPQVTISNRE